MFGIFCRAVSWGAAAAIAAGAGWLVHAGLGVSGTLVIIVGAFIFVMLAWALPLIICADAFDEKPVRGPAAAKPAARPATAAAPKPAPAPAAPAQPAAVAAASASTGAWTDNVGPSGKAGAGRGPTGIQPTPTLTEEATLRDGVGAWRYGAPAAVQAAPAPAAAGAPEEAAKPETLTAAREGGPDDLKRIKGVGPKLEEMLHRLGFYHYDQIAGWTAEEVAWVDANLEGFKGRVTRDDWVAQAKRLAAGDETEFSKKVDKGDVY